MTSTPMIRTGVRRRVLGSAVALLAALAAGASLAGTAGSQPTDDPLSESVPRPEYVDDARSFVASLDFAAPGRADQAAVTVAAVATPGTEHLKADVVVRSEGEGGVIRSATMSHPAMSFAHGTGYFFEAGRYDILAPFDARAERLRLSAIGGGDIVTVDTSAAIREYCVENPAHPDCIEADLAVTGLAASAPLFAVVGEPVTIAAKTSVTNQGPDGPVGAVTVRRATASPGLALATPAVRTGTASLAVAADRSYDDHHDVTCVTPGAHTLRLASEVAPERARVVDSDPTDDRQERVLTIDCALPITLNIKPGSVENPVRINSGVVPMAALSTTAGEYGNPVAFDATAIDAATLRFGSRTALLAGGGAAEAHERIHPEDSFERDESTRDGDLDAVLHFRRTASLQPGDTKACVFGRARLGGGTLSFFGCDDVAVKA